MKRFSVALALLLSIAPLSAQSAREHIATAQAELEAAKALLPAPGPVYTALSDHTIRPKPAPPALGPAGFAFTDPTFGSRMWRVTDAATSAGSSLRVQSNAHAASWNSNGSKFFVMNEGGAALLYGFDGARTTPLGPITTSQIEPTFSFVNPNLIFGAVSHTIKSWRLDTGAVANVFNLDTAYPQLMATRQETYIGGLLNVDGDKWAVFFGGTSADRHIFVHHSTAGLLDLRDVGWKIHSISLERSGRFVLIYPANDLNTGQLPGCPAACIAPVWIWDTRAGNAPSALAPQTNVPWGHDSVGYNTWVNATCCSGGTWDASQWQIRTLAPASAPSNLIPAVLTPQEIYLAEHSNWRAARPDTKVPIVSASYRYGAGVSQIDYPWRAWDEEIIAIATDGTGTVWRFAHTQSIAYGAAPDFNPDFWSEPIVNVAPDGKHAIFTSNWGVQGGRQDVFLVELR